MSTDTKNQATYVSFVAELQARASKAGIPVQFTEISRFVKMESAVNGHKFHVPKSAQRMALCDTTIPLTGEGCTPLTKVNGKVATYFAPDLDLIEKRIFPLMAVADVRLPANRRPASKATPVTPPVATPNPLLAEPTEEELEEMGL